MKPDHFKSAQHPSPASECKLIDLKSLLPGKGPWRLCRCLVRKVEQLLAIDRINAIYQMLPADLSLGDFCRRSLSILGIEYAMTEHDLARIPARGALVTVANHPFGALEGIILAEVLLQVRSDVRIMANSLLARIPALRPHLFAVDLFHPGRCIRKNARAMREALDWVAGGGALLTFPAGEVSHFQMPSACVADGPWSSHIAKIIVKAKAKTLPVYIHGRNSFFFNLSGTIHPLLRTVLLPRELVRKKASLIELAVGSPIACGKIADYESSCMAAEFLRFSTYLLQYRKEVATRRQWLPFGLMRGDKTKAIIAPVPKDQLVREIRALQPQSRLLDHKEFTVYMTASRHSPAIMREIGRLRELSFRDVGEGTGLSLDTDSFDDHYLQLFLWNQSAQEIVGGYRIGRSDKILRQFGPRGLYSTTLFHYQPEFLAFLGNALELGRSFIRPEYRKKFGCLAVLWRGIGEYVSRNPQYRYLFGPVSISRDYHIISRNLMVAFLRRNSMDPHMAHLVKPKRPVKLVASAARPASFAFLDENAIEDISMLISELENDSKGVPTLIKHYLKLNGQFLAFNLDKAFADVIDGLIWVDLLKTEPKVIERFLGLDGAAALYRLHRPETMIQAA